ncbi:Uncharacterised protein [Kingella potus]|uniref:Uncharacterized protein n=1 Tax=Kingella potus TaxID=265175 RepID=A0A377R3J4_9NEIS|nr:Uncharacterised protein [Kingella potus]
MPSANGNRPSEKPPAGRILVSGIFPQGENARAAGLYNCRTCPPPEKYRITPQPVSLRQPLKTECILFFLFISPLN